MENARRAAFSFFPKRSDGCAPEAFVVAKQPSAALSVTRRKFRHMTRGALAAFDAARTRLEKTSASHRNRVASIERAYRASTFEIMNLSAQKTRYVSGPLLCCCVPLCSLTHRTLRREQRALSLSLPQSLRFAGVRPGSIDPMTAVVQRVKDFAYYSLSFSRHNKNIKMEHFFLYILSYFI